MKSRSLHRRTSARAAFTLIELMVALGAGTVAVAAVYALSGTSSRTFASQLKLSDTQMSLRMAVDQVRRDFARAGYLAAVDSAGAANCNTSFARSDISFEALEVFIDGSKPGVNHLLGATNLAALAPLRLDQVQLVGNYATSEDYELSASSSESQFALETTRQAFRRSFGTTQAVWENPFEEAFTAGRMVRVEDAGGNMYFHTITSSNGAGTPTINIGSTSCVPDLRTATVAPVMKIEYVVLPIDVEHTDPALKALDGAYRSDRAADPGATSDPVAVIGAKRMALVRREINMATSEIVAGSQRVVLDYVTEFKVDGVLDTTGSGAFQLADATSSPTVFDAPCTQFRSLIVTLAARTQEVSRTRPHKGRVPAGTGTMVTFFVDSDEPTSRHYGVASVRSLKTEIMLSNFIVQR